MATVQKKVTKKKPVSKPSAPRVDEKLMEPGDYEVTPEHTFDVDVFLAQKDNRWVVVPKGKGAIAQKIVLRVWTYDEMVDLRKQATNFDAVRRMHMVDTDALDRLKIQKLLQSWTFGDDNPRLKIHRVNGVMTDESWANFKKLQANIIRYILERMNEVLEYNG
jgi:hypothetical protein